MAILNRHYLTANPAFGLGLFQPIDLSVLISVVIPREDSISRGLPLRKVSRPRGPSSC